MVSTISKPVAATSISTSKTATAKPATSYKLNESLNYSEVNESIPEEESAQYAEETVEDEGDDADEYR